jgi:hypothetical protein
MNTTNKLVYDSEEPIEISGQITNNIRSEESDVFIEVYGPDNEQVFSQTVFVNPNGSFFTSFDLHEEHHAGHKIMHIWSQKTRRQKDNNLKFI